MVEEINFDGIIGPSHNYAGLSFGNLAATRHAGRVSHPREAALQGLAKMRACVGLGLWQGVFLPHERPHSAWLAQLGTTPATADEHVRRHALSASAMWAANAATVSPAPDCADSRCHLTVANLVTMPHRSHEWPQTLAQLRIAFASQRHFTIHSPIPAPFGDEGAANHMRLAVRHDAPGVEIFVYGHNGVDGQDADGPFPARQHRQASAAVARLHRLTDERVIFWPQSPAAIAAGAFHNDVVAVANGRVLLAHEQAFADQQALYACLRARLPEVEIIEVPASVVSLEDAVATYLFNGQLLSLPEGGMALLLPTETRDNPRVWQWLEGLVATNGPVRMLVPVNVRQSMANGGGPACLRLRVVADPATIDSRFLVDGPRLDRIGEVIERWWPEAIAPADLGRPALWEAVRLARAALLTALDLPELL